MWVDGVLQVDAERAQIPVPRAKNTTARRDFPAVPDFTVQKERAVRFEGTPPLRANRSVRGRVAFRNVREVLVRDGSDEVRSFGLDCDGEDGTADVIVDRGRVACFGRYCDGDSADITIDLRGGAVVPGFMAFGSGLGIEELESEPSTGDGVQFDALRVNVPGLLGDAGGLARASDALQFSTRNAL